jgi:hypothetical protein
MLLVLLFTVIHPGYDNKLQPHRFLALMTLAVDGPLNKQTINKLFTVIFVLLSFLKLCLSTRNEGMCVYVLAVVSEAVNIQEVL